MKFFLRYLLIFCTCFVTAAEQKSKFKSSSELRSYRRASLMGELSGATGGAGLLLELCLSRDLSFIGGVGQGDKFNAFTVQIKKYYSGIRWSPYVKAGFSQWSSKKDKSDFREGRPSFFYSKLLSEKEKRKGEFSVPLIFPALGLQYFHTGGKAHGLSVFAEVQLMNQMRSFDVALSGSLGLGYFF